MRTHEADRVPRTAWFRRIQSNARHLLACCALTLLAIACLAADAPGQVNIEQYRGQEEAEGVTGAVELNMSWRTGNVDVFELGGNGRIDHRGPSTHTFLLASGDLGWEGGERYSDQALAHLRQVYRRTQRVKPEVFAQVDYDKSRLLDFRGLVGGGIRLEVYEGDAMRLWLGSSYMFEHERLDLRSDAVHLPRTSVHRWSNYLSCNLSLEARASLAWTVYAQPKFNAMGDVRVLSDSRFEVGLSGRVSLVVTFQMRFDSRQPADIESLDTTLTSGLAVAF